MIHCTRKAFGKAFGKAFSKAFRSSSPVAFRLLVTVIIGAMGVLMLPGAALANGQPLIALGDITAGMTGTARTVVSGTEVATLDVTVLGVLGQETGITGPSGFIMIQTSGPVSDQVGGIAAGMSGSPVYLDGKLAGAISYGITWFTDPTIGLVTPIHDMMRVFGYPNRGIVASRTLRPSSGPITIGSRTITSVVVAPDQSQAGRIAGEGGSNTLVFTPMQLVSVSGMNPQSKAYRFLEEKFRSVGWRPVLGGAVVGQGPPPDMAPGQSLGMNLIEGDLYLTAMGTLTYRDNEKILGFGHPFAWLGSTNVPLVSGYIHRIIPNAAAGPFKMASSGPRVGAMTQDRGEGIAGTVSETSPPVVPMLDLTVTASNMADETSNATHVRIPKAFFTRSSDWIGVQMAGIAGAYGIDRVWNQDQWGTADMTVSIKGHTERGRTLSYTRSDAMSTDFSYFTYQSGVLTTEMLSILDFIINNDYENAQVDGVSLEASIAPGRQTATVVDARLSDGRLVAGRPAKFDVTMRPFGTDDLTTVSAVMDLPTSFAVTASRVEFNPASADGYFPFFMPGMGQTQSATSTLSSELAQRERLPKARDLVVRVQEGMPEMDSGEPPFSDEPPPDGIPITGELMPQTVDTAVATSWVVNGTLAKQATEIALRAVPSRPLCGTPALLLGQLSTGRANEEVHLYGKASDETAYSLLADLTTTSQGVFSYETTVAHRGDYYATWDGDSSYFNTRSDTLTVKSRVMVLLALSRYSIRQGQVVRVNAMVFPPHDGVARLMLSTPRGWRSLGQLAAGPGGLYVAAWSPTRPGRYVVRAAWSDAAGVHPTAYSSKKLLVVRPRRR